MMEDASSSSTLIPAEVRIMFQIEGDDTYYALIHSCHEQHHKLLVLTYVWTKQYVGEKIKKLSKLKPYKEFKFGKDKKPLYQIIEIDSIHSHCLLLPLDDTGVQVLQVINTNKWADAFYKID